MSIFRNQNFQLQLLLKFYTMITLINLVDDQPEKQQINLPKLAESLINSIWSILRKKWTLHKYYINDFEQKHGTSTHYLKFSFTSIQQGIFKIFTAIRIDLACQISRLLHKSNIGSDHREIIMALPELKNSIIELMTRKKASSNSFDFSMDQNGINTTDKSTLNINFAPRQFAKNLYQKFDYSGSLCQKVIGQLTKRQLFKFQGQISKSEEKAIKVYENLGLEEKQNLRFKEFYKKERNGQSVFSNSKNIGNKKHQIVRSFRFAANQPVKQISLARDDQNRYNGGYSDVYYIKHQAQVQNTIIRHRVRIHENPEDRHLPHLRNIQNVPNTQTLILVKKVPTLNPKKRRDAQLSLMNENYFLSMLLANDKSPFICNFYLNLDLERGNQHPVYSDFHKQSISDIFFSDFKFTMLDLLNFSEQLVIALISVYLDKGFLHRDMKSGNILLSRGVIQIIDNGSVYPFDTPIRNEAIQQHKRHLDSTLRTTYKIEEIAFIKSRRLIDKYEIWTNFESRNSRHRTFDVYSVGRMLKKIIQTYESRYSPKWMEISVSWHRLIDKMIEKDFQIRIQMQNVLEQLNIIRTKIFGNQQEPNI